MVSFPLPRRELVIEIGPETAGAEWLAPWAAICAGEFRVLFLNRFGCFFLERPDGRIELLDVFYGQLEPLAANAADFAAMVGEPAWQEVYLLADYAVRLHAAGKVAAGEEAYALAPPPLAGGPDPWADRLEVESAMVLPVAALQRLYADHAKKAAEPPRSP